MTEFKVYPDFSYVEVKSGTVATTIEVKDGLIVDYDSSGKVVGYELLGISMSVDEVLKIAEEHYESPKNKGPLPSDPPRR